MTATELANYGASLPNLSMPIAANGDLRFPIMGNDNSSDSQSSIRFGLPSRMSNPLDGNGIPVPRQDINGIYNLLSKAVHYIMAGGKIPWLQAESDAIGGYPKNAEVSYQGNVYRSLVDANTYIPTDSSKWQKIKGVITVNNETPDTLGNVDVLNTRVTLFDNPGGQRSGNIILTESWRDFAYLSVLTGDYTTVLVDHIVDVKMMEDAFSNNKRFFCSYYPYHVLINYTSTDTEFVVYSYYNASMFKIVGIR